MMMELFVSIVTQMRVFRNITPFFTDERGVISKILESELPIQSILRITSTKGSVRSNHYHKHDTHWCYVLSGRMEWHEISQEGDETEREILMPGDMVETPPMMIHAARALEDSEFLAFSTETRGHDAYEEDTVRVLLIPL